MFADFEAAAFEEKTAAMPAEIEAGIPYFRSLLDRFNAAALAGDLTACQAIEQEANDLADKLNGGTHFGVKADFDSPCNVLERETAAPIGAIPIWGQAGDFIVNVQGCDIRIEFDGIYGICSPSFSAHAVDWDAPFISDTGYRSFLGHGWPPVVGMTVDRYVRAEIEQHITREMKKGLVPICQRNRDLHAKWEAEATAVTPP
jgi:hypothetical protein